MPSRILIVDDDQSTCSLVELGLRPEGFEVISATSGPEALSLLESEEIEVVLTDLNMGSMSGIDLCQQIGQRHPDLPVIVVTAFGSLETAIAAIRAGAYDFVTKPFEMEALALAVGRALRHRQLRAEVKRLRAAVGEEGWSDDLVGTSPAMATLRSLLERVAKSDATVLITGESGTGKEVVAKTLHRKGRRSAGPFVAVNCAAMPEPLLESELFGHVRGAFTDAKSARTGLLVQASGGTLLLDEIGEMPLGLQPKLLRALEERKVRPVGGSTEVTFDARIIAATNRDLETAIEEGRFREDLYYRINVLNVPLPPLRSRGGDVLLLAQHFIEHFAQQSQKEVQGLASATAAKLMAYPWPGNIRELRNCMERAVALTRYDCIAPEDLAEKIRDYHSKHVVIAGDDLNELVPLEEVERRYILRVLEAAGGNKSLAAQSLGVNRKTLYRKLAAYGVSEQ
jgi:two-component system response regulator AtoC